jgi:hypothetical protein
MFYRFKVKDYLFQIDIIQIKIQNIFAGSKYSGKFATLSNHKSSPAFVSQSKKHHSKQRFYPRGRISLKRLSITL